MRKKRDRWSILTGPTAAGKTHLSIALANMLSGEIISADLHAGLPPYGYRIRKNHAG